MFLIFKGFFCTGTHDQCSDYDGPGFCGKILHERIDTQHRAL